MPVKKKVRVNLGCGDHIMKGWINIDHFKVPPKNTKYFMEADITQELPLKPESVDYLICDQVLEHIPMQQIPAVLYNIKRVMKKGGRVVIMVPDFESAALQWIKYNKGYFNPVTYQYFSEVLYGNQAHEGEFHKTPMSWAYLHYLLDMVGLNHHEITIFPEGGLIPDYPGIEYPEGAKLRNAQLAVDIIKT